MINRLAASWEERLADLRSRTPAYVGSVGVHGLRSLLEEVWDHGVEEAIRGGLSCIDIVLHTDGSVSVSSSRSPAEGQEVNTGVPALLEALVTPYDPDVPRMAGAMTPIGLSGVSGLSEWLEVTVRAGNGVQALRFERGHPAGEPQVPDVLPAETQSRIRYRPDRQIFTETRLPAGFVVRRARMLSYLVPGVRFTVHDEAAGSRASFCNPGGLSELVETMSVGRPVWCDPVTVRHRAADLHLDAAILFSEHDQPGLLRAFANHRPTQTTGPHIKGLREGLLRGLNDRAPEARKAIGARVRQRELELGLFAVISVRVPRVRFEGMCRDILANEEVRQPVAGAVHAAVLEAVRQEPSKWRWL